MKLIKNVGWADTISEMTRMLHEGIRDTSVRAKALEVTSGHVETIVPIFVWIKSRTQYVLDPVNVEMFTSPRKMLERIRESGRAEEDCDGLALLTAAMLGSVGHKVRIALMDLNADDELDHAICQVYDENTNQWLNADTSSTNPLGWEVSSDKTEYILGE